MDRDTWEQQWLAHDGYTTADTQRMIRRRIARVHPRWWETDAGDQQVNDNPDADEVERIGSRLHVDRVLAELVSAARQGVDPDTLRQLARVRLELFDDLDVVELLLLAAGMFAELGIRNAARR